MTFGAYRVFGCGGSANDDVILAALEQAYADGMDVVNMSLGDAFNSWPQAPLAQASDTLLKHGVVVVASIGNSGANGVYSDGAPGVGERVIGVASYDNTFVTSTARPYPGHAGRRHRRLQNMSGAAASAAPFSGSLPLAKTARPRGRTMAARGRRPYAGFPAGAMAIVQRGTCTFYDQGRSRLRLAGASAVVLYNNVAGRVSPTSPSSQGRQTDSR